jgi:hypothetical protein
MDSSTMSYKRHRGLTAGPTDKGVVLDRAGIVLVEAVVSTADLDREVPADRPTDVQTAGREVRLVQGILLIRGAEV